MKGRRWKGWRRRRKLHVSWVWKGDVFGRNWGMWVEYDQNTVYKSIKEFTKYY